MRSFQLIVTHVSEIKEGLSGNCQEVVGLKLKSKRSLVDHAGLAPCAILTIGPRLLLDHF